MNKEKEKEKEIELAIRQLMATCEKHQVTMAGVIDDNDLGLCAFESLNKPDEVKEGFFNIHTLVQQRGDIGGFLCEISRIEDSAKKEPKPDSSHSSQEEQASLFGKSNAQIYNTFH